jgi:hypothetical protein
VTRRPLEKVSRETAVTPFGTFWFTYLMFVIAVVLEFLL